MQLHSPKKMHFYSVSEQNPFPPYTKITIPNDLNNWKGKKRQLFGLVFGRLLCKIKPLAIAHFTLFTTTSLQIVKF